MIKTIIRYEKARQNVADLSQKKSYLIGECETVDIFKNYHGEITDIGKTCGQKAWDYFTSEDDDNCNFDDAFYVYINDENGACDKCLKAREITTGELAAAKKEFGTAKMMLSFYGKKLILEEAES